MGEETYYFRNSPEPYLFRRRGIFQVGRGGGSIPPGRLAMPRHAGECIIVVTLMHRCRGCRRWCSHATWLVTDSLDPRYQSYFLARSASRSNRSIKSFVKRAIFPISGLTLTLIITSHASSRVPNASINRSNDPSCASRSRAYTRTHTHACMHTYSHTHTYTAHARIQLVALAAGLMARRRLPFLLTVIFLPVQSTRVTDDQSIEYDPAELIRRSFSRLMPFASALGANISPLQFSISRRRGM